MNLLPLSEPRCIGHRLGGTWYLRLECLTCLRRTAPRAEATFIEPPEEHPCPKRIAPEVSE